VEGNLRNLGKAPGRECSKYLIVNNKICWDLNKTEQQ